MADTIAVQQERIAQLEKELEVRRLFSITFFVSVYRLLIHSKERQNLSQQQRNLLDTQKQVQH
jgi:hypothetical protein